jgi:hypothetical protein
VPGVVLDSTATASLLGSTSTMHAIVSTSLASRRKHCLLLDCRSIHNSHRLLRHGKKLYVSEFATSGQPNSLGPNWDHV